MSTEPVAISTQTTLRLLTGTIEVVTASKAISANADLYVTTDGKVSDAAVGTQIGIAITAATANGGKISAVIWGVNGGSNPFVAPVGQCTFFDDFFTYDNTATVGGYAEVSDSGTIAAIDASNGVLSFATGGTAQNETYVSTLQEIFLFQTDKNGFFEIGFTHTEANTNDANLIFGLSDNAAANFLQDAGAGPAASFDGAVFYKLFDELVWNFMASNATVQDSETSISASTTGVYTRLGFKYEFKDGVTASITPFVNGVAGTAVDLTISGLAEMHIVMGAKAGGANAETVLVDYVYYTQDR